MSNHAQSIMRLIKRFGPKGQIFLNRSKPIKVLLPILYLFWSTSIARLMFLEEIPLTLNSRKDIKVHFDGLILSCTDVLQIY